MAEAILPLVAERFFSIIEDKIWEEVNLVRGFDEEVDNLSKKLKKTRQMLDDAEKQRGLAGTKSASDWKSMSESLKELEDASYELDDVLDEWYTALRMFQIQHQNSNANAHHVPDPNSYKVCNYTSFISCSCFPKLVVRRDTAKKLQKLKQKIDSILADKDQFVLVPTGKPHSSTMNWRGQSTSFVDVAEICGRDIEREDLVRRVTLALLQAEDQTNHLEILSIVGVGGVGKTTLAQLVYNDSRVCECFELRIWLCVSDPFDEVTVAKNIIEGVTKKSPDSNQLEVLLQSLKECISGKKYLLVMDDVWTGDSSKWKPLITCLRNGNIGSKILVTTRNERVAKMIGSPEDGIHHLRELSEEACWLLLQRIALSGRDRGEWKRFVSVGMKIANKCKGLPLAAKALGSLLYFKKSLEEWENVLNSEIWELEGAEDEIFPHLHLSYNELSPTLKRCFSYCAVFPKDTRIDVAELIQHWMALGYLGGIGDMELRGREYFDQLAMRCLFQDFEEDDFDGKIVCCKMHDIVHDFALLLRKNIDEEAGIKTTSTCNVCSPEIICRAKKYRSFGNREPHRSLCDCVANLRVLYLGEFGGVRIPEIEKFIHLRWLDLSRNDLAAKDLETISRLYNLQTLLLQHCDLKEITKEIGNLIHLRHLDLSYNGSLKELPREIGNLIRLRHLDLSENYSLKELPREIGNLIHLRHLDLSWNESLKELPREIGNLIHLRHLDLSWNESLKELPREIGNLIHLRHLDLSRKYSLKELPSEIGNLIHLRHLDLSRNVSLMELPESLCELHELQRLNIDYCKGICRLPQGLHRLENLKHLHNHDNESLGQFPEGVAQLSGLCTLCEFRAGSGRNKLGWLKNLNRLSGSLTLVFHLAGSENIVEDAREGELRKKECIEELNIKFEGMLDGDWEWVNLLDALSPHPNLLKLQVYDYGGSELPSWVVSPVLNKLKFIRLDGFSRLSSLSPLGRLPCLEEIVINRIDKLKVVGPEFLGTTTEGSSNSFSTIVFSKLKRLTFERCDNWREWKDITTNEEAAAAADYSVMPCLTKLVIFNCKSLTALPHRLLASSSLEKLDITYSTRLEILYGERQGSAWKSISDVCPRLRLRYSFCFDSIQHGLVTTSHVELPAEIYGRDFERDDLARRMVDQTNHLQILSIVGPSGVGKTTLAQLVYDDGRVSECFELRIWIRVSGPFNHVRVAKAIIGSVTKKCPDSDELDFLLQTLKDAISGNKFLLVMDGVWKEQNPSRLEPLITTLKNGSIGSKVLVTTRYESTAKVMGSLEDEIHHLGEVSDEIASCRSGIPRNHTRQRE